MFKVNDKVRIKSKEILQGLYKEDKFDLVKSMIKYGGKETKIKEVIDKENWNESGLKKINFDYIIDVSLYKQGNLRGDL